MYVSSVLMITRFIIRTRMTVVEKCLQLADSYSVSNDNKYD